MDNEKDVIEYTTALIHNVAAFREHWKAQHAANPQDYPETLTPGEWEDQFEAWLSIHPSEVYNGG